MNEDVKEAHLTLMKWSDTIKSDFVLGGGGGGEEEIQDARERFHKRSAC